MLVSSLSKGRKCPDSTLVLTLMPIVSNDLEVGSMNWTGAGGFDDIVIIKWLAAEPYIYK